jgi:hypothetical protein
MENLFLYRVGIADIGQIRYSVVNVDKQVDFFTFIRKVVMNLSLNCLSNRTKTELKNRKKSVIAMLVIALSFPAISQATIVNYATTSLGGDVWRYDYVIKNDTLSNPIAEFTVYFPESLYENLVVLSSSADWDSIVVQPDPGLPASGFFDALSISSGLAPNASDGVFTVKFTYLGTSIPGVQLFDVYDDSFNLLDNGFTLLASPVPEPDTFVMMMLGLALLTSYKTKRGTLRS